MLPIHFIAHLTSAKFSEMSFRNGVSSALGGRLGHHFGIDLAAPCIGAAYGNNNAIGDSTRLNSNLDIGDRWIDATAATTRHLAVIVTGQKLSNGIADAVSFRRLPYTKTKITNVFTHIPESMTSLPDVTQYQHTRALHRTQTN